MVTPMAKSMKASGFAASSAAKNYRVERELDGQSERRCGYRIHRLHGEDVCEYCQNQRAHEVAVL